MLRIATYLDSRFKDEVGQLQLKLDVKYALVEFIRKEEGTEIEDSADSTSGIYLQVLQPQKQKLLAT